MNQQSFVRAWENVITMPEQNRLVKPRDTGLTMIIDKGLNLQATADLLELAADFIDFWKIAFGSSALYPFELMRTKINLIKSYGVEVYPGGTLLEIAAYQGRLPELYVRARELGFTYLEVSEGTIDLPQKWRTQYIKQALQEGFGVVTEIGKKDKRITLDATATADQVAQDLADGAYKVIIEGRDSGTGVGIYDDQGKVIEDLLDDILERVTDINDLFIEAPKTSQHNYLLTKIGPNVNLGNVQPEDVITLESTRNGLRGDTLRNLLKSIPAKYN